MSELILKALMQLFALISDIHDDTVITSREKDVVRSFLAKHLNSELVIRYMKMFEEYLGLYNSERITKGSLQDKKRVALNAMKILSICEQISEELQQKQKVYVVVQLTDFISSGSEVTENELDFLQTVASAFYIPLNEYHNIKSFIISTLGSVPEKWRLLVVNNNEATKNGEIKHLFVENLVGEIRLLHISSTNTIIMQYSGSEDLYLNGQNIFSGQTYIFDHGSTIRGSGISTIYYTEVVSIISESSFDSRILLDARGVTFRFRNSENGIHDLNFREDSGKLVGIIGGSGVGKSTTLSVLSGMLKPQSGDVLINGYDLYDREDKEHLKGVIGFVPQDDLLIEELTVYQNLWYNARMCLDKLPGNKLAEVVEKTLADFDLLETRDLKVGNPLNKVISGGQRKRVNIALELLREPTILFVDEPTSGLSSVDSEIVMNLLKEQTYKGRLVIVNIHQPSSEIYKMFDKIMVIDKGGYQIYYGNPTEAIVYFKTHSNHANPEEDQCIKCGNVNTDQLLQIIEAKVVDEHGKPTRIRRITPGEWADKFRDKIGWTKEKPDKNKQKLPDNNYSIPGLFKQSVIFFSRDFLAKLADKQYILISLLGPPLLALLLAHFTKYSSNSSYIFRDNTNIPAYLFMCVITSLFFGLMLSSEEIVKDRKILKRESFLNLSWFSYLNSKILIMFLLSAIQTISFVLIGNLILEIRGMTLSYWLVLFTTSCFGNILGLNISSAFNSVITIYIIIPFILIPQLLFSGVLVKYDKLHLGNYSSLEYVPVIGDLMTARWSFEAVAVEQFKNNRYMKNYISHRIKTNPSDFYSTSLIDALAVDLHECLIYSNSADYRNTVEGDFKKLNYYIDKMSLHADTSPGLWKRSLNYTGFTPAIDQESRKYLEVLKKKFRKEVNKLTSVESSINVKITKEIGEKGFRDLRDNYENARLNFLALDEENTKFTLETNSNIIQKYNPGYMKATSKFGRAHFYAPVKRLGKLEIDTYWFNLVVLWIGAGLFYLALYFNLFRRILSYFENLRFQKSET
jgi:ABC-type multidrug transport system ATPase subunit